MLSGLITVSNALISAILEGAPLPEAERHALAEAAGIDLEQVRDVNSRTSIFKLARLWNSLLQATDDPFMGLRIGTAVPAERFGLAAHAARHGSDFREALSRLQRYARLINDLIRCELREDQKEARFSMRFLWNVSDLERHAVDITFASIKTWTRHHLPREPRLIEVRFKHSDDPAKERCKEIFDCSVKFGAPKNELIFEASSLLLPVISADRELGSILERHANHEISRIQDIGDLPDRVSQAIYRNFESSSEVTLPLLAKELQMSHRDLQRKLNDKGTSFSALLEEARKVLAPRFLGELDSNVEQTGFRLGYSDTTAFIRAFKKWYRTTPGAYRGRKDQ